MLAPEPMARLRDAAQTSRRPAPRRPLLTLALLALITSVYVFVPGPESLAFNATAVSDGEVWRLFSGHFVHADGQHLVWNGFGLAVLAYLIERRSRGLLLGSLTAGILIVDLLLLSPLSMLEQYCGLSGVLNTLLVTALALEWRHGGGWPVLLVAGGSIAKLFWELSHGQALLTHISWPPFPAAHAAGMIGGFALLMIAKFRKVYPAPSYPVKSPHE